MDAAILASIDSAVVHDMPQVPDICVHVFNGRLLVAYSGVTAFGQELSLAGSAQFLLQA